MSCIQVPIQTILGSECIGDSLPKINTNFSSLENAACDLITNFNTLSTYTTNLLSLINTLSTTTTTLSTNMQNIGNYPYLEYAWVTAPNANGQSIPANIITTLNLTTEVADIGNFGDIGPVGGGIGPNTGLSLNENEFGLKAGTYIFEMNTSLRATAQDVAATLSLYNVSDTLYITRGRNGSSDTSDALSCLILKGQFTINVNKRFRIQLLVSHSSTIDNGEYNVVHSNSTAGADQRTTIKLWKVG